MVTDSDMDFRILYIDDEIDDIMVLFEYMVEKYGAQSRYAKSVNTAKKILDEWEQPPDFAIHDCRILFRDTDSENSILAGNELYVELLSRDIPVIVISGDDAGMEEEPYLSEPPALGFCPSPLANWRLTRLLEGS